MARLLKQAAQHSMLTSGTSKAAAPSSTTEVYMYIPKSIQHKQLGLISCKANLIDSIVDHLHFRVQHRVDAFEIKQVAALHVDDVVGVSGGRMPWVDVLRQHAFVVFEAGGSHGGRVGRVTAVEVVSRA